LHILTSQRFRDLQLALATGATDDLGHDSSLDRAAATGTIYVAVLFVPHELFLAALPVFAGERWRAVGSG
jgi:hypothetical protein